MNSATFVSKADSCLKLGDAVQMVLLKDKHVVDAGLPALLSASKRTFFYNRRPAIISALNRRGNKEDVDMPFEASGVFTTYEVDAGIVVGRKGELAVLEIKTAADNKTSIAKTVAPAALPAEAIAATFIESSASDLVVLLANGAVLRVSGADLATVVELRKALPCKGAFISAAGDYVVVPSKEGADVISLTTKKSALAGAWAPHANASGAEPIIAAHLFRQWRPAGKPSTAAPAIVMTVGANGREVRLWTGLGNTTLDLAAHLALDLPKDAAGPKRVAIADREENVLISYGNKIVALTTDVAAVRFSRATEWSQELPILAFAAFNEMTKAGDYQLTMVCRTPDGIQSTKMPPAIMGAPNLATDGSAAPPAAAAAPEANFFATTKKESAASVVVSSSLASGPSGAEGTAAAVGEKAAAAAIAAVAADAVSKVSALSSTAAATNKEVSALISSLQSPATQAAAAKQGQDYASRNATRFTAATATAAPTAAAPAPATSAPASGKSIEQLNIISTSMKDAVKNAVVARSDALVVNKTVKNAMEALNNSANNANADPLADVALPKLTSLPQMQSYTTGIDKALKGQNDFLKAEADSRASTYNTQVVRTTTATRGAIAESKKFLADLKNELAGLTQDIEAVKAEFAAAAAARGAIGTAASTENLVEDCVAHVEKKEFEHAVQKATSAKNVHLLLEVLSHPTVKNAAEEGGAFSPGSISAPSFGMLVQQLAAEITHPSSKGYIAPRVANLCSLCIDWDDYIDETLEGADEKAKALMNTLAPSMGAAARYVEALQAIKDDVSIESRRQARTVARVLAKFAQQ